VFLFISKLLVLRFFSSLVLLIKDGEVRLRDVHMSGLCRRISVLVVDVMIFRATGG
jgi:hypothetical protein